MSRASLVSKKALSRFYFQATGAQMEYIHQLFIDCGFHTTIHRREFLKHRFKTVEDVSGLTKAQAIQVINELKQIKESKKNNESD